MKPHVTNKMTSMNQLSQKKPKKQLSPVKRDLPSIENTVEKKTLARVPQEITYKDALVIAKAQSA